MVFCAIALDCAMNSYRLISSPERAPCHGTTTIDKLKLHIKHNPIGHACAGTRGRKRLLGGNGEGKLVGPEGNVLVFTSIQISSHGSRSLRRTEACGQPRFPRL